MRTPDGTRTLFHLHAVGTQNYSAGGYHSPLRRELVYEAVHSIFAESCPRFLASRTPTTPNSASSTNSRVCHMSHGDSHSGAENDAACAAEDGKYVSTGSTAELFDGTFKKGAHYVDGAGVPVWEVHDNDGAVQGSVKGRALTKVARERKAWDGDSVCRLCAVRDLRGNR